MKQMVTTKQKTRYVLSYYKLIKVFEYVKKYQWGESIRYEDEYMISEGCYKKVWQLTFWSERALIRKTKELAKKQKTCSFFAGINSLVKKRDSYGYVLDIENNANKDYWHIDLKKRKKKNIHKKKKSRRYYCDCFYCTGTTFERKHVINLSDEKKLYY